MVQSRCQGPGAMLSAETVFSAACWRVMKPLCHEKLSRPNAHSLKQLCHGVPPNPVSPQNPAHALGSDMSCYCRSNLWIKQWWRLYKHRAIYRHCIPREITSKTLATGAPLGVHTLHAEARQLALLVPGGPPCIAASVRAVTLPSLTLHSFFPTLLSLLSSHNNSPCLAFLTN